MNNLQLFIPPEMPPVHRLQRQEWLKDGNKPGYINHTPKRIVVHHSSNPKKDGFKGAETIRAIHRHHTVNNGWIDIGYHFIIAPYGNIIFEGRPATVIGAHCGGTTPKGHARNFGNTGSVGICLLGDYDNEQPDQNALYTLSILILSLQQKYKIASHELYGHCENCTPKIRRCPGEILFKRLMGENRQEKVYGS